MKADKKVKALFIHTFLCILASLKKSHKYELLQSSRNYARFVHKMGRISAKVSFDKSNSKDVSLRTLQIFYVFGVFSICVSAHLRCKTDLLNQF